MRLFPVLFACIISFAAKAQTTHTNDDAIRPAFAQNIHYTDSLHEKKWSLNKYMAVSTGFSFFKGGNATTVAVPVGLQLNRKINNNVYAFFAVSAAPAYINFNNAFLNNGAGKLNGSNTFTATQLGVFSRAEVGLMYVNDAKTFSISGSVGIERSSYPIYPVNQFNAIQPGNNRLPVYK